MVSSSLELELSQGIVSLVWFDVESLRVSRSSGASGRSGGRLTMHFRSSIVLCTQFTRSSWVRRGEYHSETKAGVIISTVLFQN